MFAYCNNNPVMYADALGYAMRYNTVMINDGGSERTTWVDRCLRSLAEQRERLTRCCASIAQTIYYDTIPDFARDWSSPVDHADYHNSAECAAFGYPRGDRKHKGVDFYPSDSGTNAYGADGTAKNVYAMSSGSVYMVSSSFYKNSGALHVIQDDGYYVIYGEIDASGWSVGDRINKGQLIGIMQRADSIGDPSLMLHLEIYADGARRPENLIDPTFVYRLVDRYVYD